MSVPFTQDHDTYTKYVIQTFGPRMQWHKRFALWPRRSTLSNQLIWFESAVVGFHEYRVNLGMQKMRQQLAVVTEEEFTYLSLVNFFQEAE